MEKIVQFLPAFDKRNSDPSKNYGIHGVDLRMILKGDNGAVQFVLYTNWQLSHVQAETDRKYFDKFFYQPMPADLGYHSPTPRYEGQDKMKCDLFPSGECYYDGSSLNAQRIFNVLLVEGDEGVWRELEKYYKELFDSEKT